MQGLVRGFDLVKITVPSYTVQTLQEMVSPDPQIIVVAPGAEPESTQVQHTEDRGTIIRIFWVGLKGELLKRIPVSSVMQVGVELLSPPESTAFARRLQAGPRLGRAQPAFPRAPQLEAAGAAPGSRAAPGGAQDPAVTRGASQPAPTARAGGRLAPHSSSGIFPPPAATSGDPRSSAESPAPVRWPDTPAR